MCSASLAIRTTLFDSILLGRLGIAGVRWVDLKGATILEHFVGQYDHDKCRDDVLKGGLNQPFPFFGAEFKEKAKEERRQSAT
mmetsp:Transcript_113617/g.317319  ORF Transcript_113617/g.317319 Transcript_113617/m.317319 type:complete len:83 (-) Transcript_113617:810-1058(-)